jgi:hypothetical protein
VENGDGRNRIVLVDGGAIAGWRRATPSLAQLHQALLHLHAQHSGARVAVVADPSLKHRLSAGEQADFEADVALGVIVCAPAGTIGGADGFFIAIAERAERDGADVVMVTDRALPFGRLAALRREEGRWTFDLEGEAPGRDGAAPSRRRRTRS